MPPWRAHQDEGPGRSTFVDDATQVAAQLVDGVSVGRSPATTAWGTLVPEDQSGFALQVAALEVPRVEVERVSVAEHDGDVRHGRVVRFIDLGVQARHRPRLPVPGLSGGEPNGCPRRAATGTHCASAAVRPLHWSPLRLPPRVRPPDLGRPVHAAPPRCRRGSRGPKRVTIS